MNHSVEPVRIKADGDALSGAFFVPAKASVPAVVVCHGAGEYKENYYELCGYLAKAGIAALALDMRGHGQSEGERFCVDMPSWVADVRAAVGFLRGDSRIDPDRVGGFGLSSGGTAILEAAALDSSLKSLVVVGATVRNSMPAGSSLILHLLNGIGWMTRCMTTRSLRVPIDRFAGNLQLAADPEVNSRIKQDPRFSEAMRRWPFPGSRQAFFVDTLKRVSRIAAPTMVLWGAEDRLDPPETARLLYEALACEKQLHVIAGNGHAGHLDRNRGKVFALTAEWASRTLRASAPVRAG